MANTSFNFDIDPYYDDFASEGGPKDQNYMRILFRPGKAVQARELTQMQSILQNQIKSFGDHVFKDGSPVQGGHLTVDTTVKSVKLQAQYNNVDIDLTNFDGELILDNATSNTKAVVITTDSTQTNPTLLVKYLSASEFTTSQVVKVANTTIFATTLGSTPGANASAISINEGIFYVDGYFVYVAPQTIVLDPYSNTPSYKVGLQIADDIIDESEDSSLLDPAQSSFNYQAPGATRYKFALELTKRALNSTDDTKFFELLRVENGIVTRQVNYPIYSEIEKTLARRTYDESGDYTVKPFRVTVSENQTTANTFKVNIEPGKAYVKGYEFETFGAVSIVNQKANTTATSTDYDFSLDYGNYLTVTNLRGSNSGFANLASYESFDVHTVPTASINTKSAAAYSNTKIGTLRVRNIDFAGSSDYYLYVLDINTSPIVMNVATNAANALSLNLGSTFSSLTDGYKGVYVRMVAGTGYDSYTRQIVNYDGATKIAVVDSSIPFSANLTTASQVSLAFNIKDADSVVKAPSAYTGNVYALQEAANGFLPCMDISNTGKTSDGKAILADPNRNKLLYQLPETYVAPNSFTNVVYYKKHAYGDQSSTFASSNATFTLTPPSGTDKFFFGNGDLSSTTARQNFVVIVRDKQTSGYANGDVIDLATSPNLISQSTETSLTVRVKSTAAFKADIVATLKVEGAGSGGKTLRGNTSNTTLSATDAYTSGTAVVGTSNGVYINKTKDLQVWYKDPTYIKKTPGQTQSLYLTDVIRIIKVFDSQNVAHAPNTTNSLESGADITDRYILDSGQRDSYYDYASITLRDGAAAPSGQTVFLLQGFDQTGTTYFNSASYSNVYANNAIPNIATKSGIISLRDAVDFRPSRSDATVVNPSTFTLDTRDIPSPEFSFQATYQYYVPRIDKLVLTRDKEFQILKGAPSISPVPPKNSDDAMTLYNIFVPAYTANVAEIGLQYHENRRYTMRDIGALEKRIENLEYYTSLNILELQAKNEPILYEDNILEKEKYGIIADDFSTFAVADVISPDLNCNISRKRLGPYRSQIPFGFTEASSTAQKNERTITLPYTEEACVVQNTATKAVTVQPYEFAQFYGTMKLYPETDYWYSRILNPEIITSSTSISPVTESPPSSAQPTPAPEINPSANLVSAPTTVGVPSIAGGLINPSDGFGSIDINNNWFGNGMVGNLFNPSVANFDSNFGSSIPGITGAGRGTFNNDLFWLSKN